MKTKRFELTSLCHAVVLGKNRALKLYYKDEVIGYFSSISRCGGLRLALKEAKIVAYKRVNH